MACHASSSRQEDPGRPVRRRAFAVGIIVPAAVNLPRDRMLPGHVVTGMVRRKLLRPAAGFPRARLRGRLDSGDLLGELRLRAAGKLAGVRSRHTLLWKSQNPEGLAVAHLASVDMMDRTLGVLPNASTRRTGPSCPPLRAVTSQWRTRGSARRQRRGRSRLRCPRMRPRSSS